MDIEMRTGNNAPFDDLHPRASVRKYQTLKETFTLSPSLFLSLSRIICTSVRCRGLDGDNELFLTILLPFSFPLVVTKSRRMARKSDLTDDLRNRRPSRAAELAQHCAEMRVEQAAIPGD